MWRITISLIFLLFSQTPYAQDGLVVISSNYSQIDRGDIVNVGQIIELPANKSLRLISASGNVFDLQGPYVGKIELSTTRGNDSILKSISRLVKDSKATDYTLATFRSGSTASLENRHDIWGVDIRKPGNYCVRLNRPVYLWWPQALHNTLIILTDITNSRSIEMEWPARKKIIGWPKAMPLDNHVNYSVENKESQTFVTFTIRLLPTGLSDEMGQIAWMSDHDCKKQAIRLLGVILARTR